MTFKDLYKMTSEAIVKQFHMYQKRDFAIEWTDVFQSLEKGGAFTNRDHYNREDVREFIELLAWISFAKGLKEVKKETQELEAPFKSDKRRVASHCERNGLSKMKSYYRGDLNSIELFKKIARKIPFVSSVYRTIRGSRKANIKHSVSAESRIPSNLSDEQLAVLTLEERDSYFIDRFVPEKARLDVSTVCQLRCAGCFFQRGENDNIGRGFLSLENFKRFLEMNPFIREIEISNWGEPFLNPNIIDMMRFAKAKRVALTCGNGSNFNAVSDELIHALVDNEFRRITLSIDGASSETYSKYRVGGDFNQVMNNIRRLQAYKKRKKSLYPELIWQYVLMEHNELEVKKAKDLAKELRIPIKFKLNWDKSYKPVNRQYLMEETGLKELTREEYSRAYGVNPLDFICTLFFTNPQINWDGRLLGCCDNLNAFDVNVFETGLIAAIRSSEYITAKKCLMTVHPGQEQYSECICYGCERRLKREMSGIRLKM